MSNIELMDPSLEKLNSGERITIVNSNVPRPSLNGAIQKRNLYLNLLNIPPGDYSKELFITLLDKAEEQGCKNVILCLDKNASIRPFAFLGFNLLPPDHPLVPGKECSRNMLFMNYEIESDDI